MSLFGKILGAAVSVIPGGKLVTKGIGLAGKIFKKKKKKSSSRSSGISKSSSSLFSKFGGSFPFIARPVGAIIAPAAVARDALDDDDAQKNRNLFVTIAIGALAVITLLITLFKK